jgi:hypothetical protein
LTLKQRIDQHDREIAAIRKLMLTGMKMLVRSEKRIDNLTTAVNKLEKNVDRFVKSMTHPRNGRAKS